MPLPPRQLELFGPDVRPAEDGTAPLPWHQLGPVSVPPRLRGRYQQTEAHSLLQLAEELRRLQARKAVELTLSVHDNRRTLVSLRRPAGGARMRLRLHWALALDVQTCVRLADWGLQHGDLPPWCRDWMLTWLRQEHLHARLQDDRRQSGHHAEAHALNIELAAVCTWAGLERPPPGTQALWMQGPFRLGAQRVRLGAADTLRREIRVHPVLSLPEVPTFCLQSVLFHELCHLIAPPLTPAEARERGEHRVHHRSFDALTARDPYATIRDAWMRTNLRRVLAIGRRRGHL